MLRSFLGELGFSHFSKIKIKDLFKTTLGFLIKLNEKNADLDKKIQEMKNAMDKDLSNPKSLELLITNSAGRTTESIVNESIEFQYIDN